MMMDYDADKIDDMILALLFLNSFTDEYGIRAWKSFDWDSLNRLHERNYIGNPVGKAKSVTLTPEGLLKAETLFKKYFTNSEQ